MQEEKEFYRLYHRDKKMLLVLINSLFHEGFEAPLSYQKFSRLFASRAARFSLHNKMYRDMR